MIQINLLKCSAWKHCFLAIMWTHITHLERTNKPSSMETALPEIPPCRIMHHKTYSELACTKETMASKCMQRSCVNPVVTHSSFDSMRWTYTRLYQRFRDFIQSTLLCELCYGKVAHALKCLIDRISSRISFLLFYFIMVQSEMSCRQQHEAVYPQLLSAKIMIQKVSY